MTKLVKGWNHYWFRPAPLVNLAVFRLLAVAFQIYYLVTVNNQRHLFDLAALPDMLYAPLPVLRLLLLPFGAGYRPALGLLQVVLWVSLLSGLFSWIGLKTRISLLIFAVANLFIQAYVYSYGDFHHSDALMLMALLLLALAPSGEVLSLDAVLRRKGRTASLRQVLAATSDQARWPLLLLQWLFALVYFSAAFSKLSKGGLDWMNGYTLQFYILRDATFADNRLGMYLGQIHWLVLLLSVFTILFEGTFFLTLLFPKLIWLYAPAGVALHLGIDLTGVADFPQFMVLYTIFIPWAALGAWLLRGRYTRQGVRAAARKTIPKDESLPDQGIETVE